MPAEAANTIETPRMRAAHDHGRAPRAGNHVRRVAAAARGALPASHRLAPTLPTLRLTASTCLGLARVPGDFVTVDKQLDVRRAFSGQVSAHTPANADRRGLGVGLGTRAAVRLALGRSKPHFRVEKRADDLSQSRVRMTFDVHGGVVGHGSSSRRPRTVYLSRACECRPQATEE